MNRRQPRKGIRIAVSLAFAICLAWAARSEASPVVPGLPQQHSQWAADEIRVQDCVLLATVTDPKTGVPYDVWQCGGRLGGPPALVFLPVRGMAPPPYPLPQRNEHEKGRDLIPEGPSRSM